MRTRKTFINIIFNFLQQIIGVITGLILPPLIVGKFGSSLNGLVSTIKQMMTYVQLTGAGIAASSTYAMYKPLAQEDHKKISGIYNAANKMFIKAGNIFSIIVLIISVIYPFYVSADDNIPFIVVCLLVIVISVCGLSEFYVFGKYQTLLDADQNNYIIAIAQSIGNICNIVITVILIHLNQNIIVVQLGASIVYVMRILIVSWYVKNNYTYLDSSVAPLMEEINQKNDAIIHELTTLVVLNSSTIFVSLFLGLKEASVFAIYTFIFSGLNMICSVVSNAIYASFGDVIASENREVLDNAFNQYEWIYLFAIGILYTVTFIVVMPFVSVYTMSFTDYNYYLPMMGVLYTAVGFFTNLRTPARTLVVAAGHYKATKNRAILEVIINVLGQIIFIYLFGIYGALLGCICSHLYRTPDFILYANKHILKRNNVRSVKRVIVNLSMLVILGYLGIFIIPQTMASYAQWVGYSFITTIVIILCYLGINYFVDRESLEKTFHTLLHIFK